jgi:hypothetical protein
MAFLVLAGFAFTAVVVFLTFALVAVVFKIAIRLILLPLLLLKWIVIGAVLAVAGLVLMLPLLPILSVGAIVWMLVRANRRPAVA